MPRHFVTSTQEVRPPQARPAHVTGIGRSGNMHTLIFWAALQGPCVSIDTACSSSLVTAHFAAQAMRGPHGCTNGLSAGVNLPMNWETSALFVGAAMTSADGRCKALDAAADGYARAEACVAISLRYV